MSLQEDKGSFEIFDASAYKVAVVAAQFNQDISSQLLASALEACKAYSVPSSSITVHKVPGCVEVPVILEALAETKKYDCLIALGTIIRGETPHFEYVAKIAADGALQIMMDYGVPVGFGILTCENKAQALARTDAGASAVSAALECVRIKKSL